MKMRVVLVVALCVVCGCRETAPREQLQDDLGHDAARDLEVEEADMPPDGRDADHLDGAQVEDLPADLLQDMEEDSAADSASDDAADSAADSALDGALDEGFEEVDGLDVCEGSCRVTALTLQQGPLERPLTRAVYGLSSPESSLNGGWELYIEGLEGGGSGCPTQGSPTPKYTMVLGGVGVFLDRQELTQDDGISLIVFDYQGDIVPDPPFRVRADTVRVRPLARSACEECGEEAAGEVSEGYVALEVEAQWSGGGVSGGVYATRCASLDEL